MPRTRIGRSGVARCILAAALGPCVLAMSATTATAEATRVDARAEVAAALYAASATQAAAERAADARLREAHGRIQRLAAQGASVRSELIAAQERYVADLSTRDRAYAQEIAVFREAVADIAQTPEGAAALARFNAGDELGAIAILDQLIDARARARQARANVETAAERRRVARLALDAARRQRLDKAAVIARFEEVVRLDPSEHEDWLELRELYGDVGRTNDALRAASRAVETAPDDAQRGHALYEWGVLLGHSGDYAAARRRLGQGVALQRARAAADPSSAEIAKDACRVLLALARTVEHEGDRPAAETSETECLGFARRHPDARSAIGLQLVHTLEDVALARQVRRDFRGAQALYEEARAFAQARGAEHDFQSSLRNLAQTARQSGDLARARLLQEQYVELKRPDAEAERERERQITDRRASGLSQHVLANGLEALGDIASDQGDIDGALAAYLENLAIRRTLPREPAALQWALDKAADTLMRVRRYREARALYEEVLRIRRNEAARGESLAFVDSSLIRVARAAFGQGDFAAARTAAQEGVDLARRSFATSNSARDERQLAEGLAMVGDALMARGDLAGARRAYEESLAARRDLPTENVHSSYRFSFRRAVATGLGFVCEVLVRQGQLAEGRARCEERVRVLGELEIPDDDMRDFVEPDFAQAQFALGEIALIERRNEDALRHLREAAPMFARAAARKPAEWRASSVGAQFRLAQAEGDEAGVALAVAQWRALTGPKDSAPPRWAVELDRLSRTRSAAAP